MITRYALFQREIAAGRLADFKKAVVHELLPTWLVYPGATAVRVSFAADRDDQAPNVSLVLAVDFASREGLEAALSSQERLESRAATQRVLQRLLTGQIFHHVTGPSEHLVAWPASPWIPASGTCCLRLSALAPATCGAGHFETQKISGLDFPADLSRQKWNVLIDSVWIVPLLRWNDP